MKITYLVKFIFLLPLLCVAKPIEVGEQDMPELSNQATPFRGKINHSGYSGHTWVTYPHVENPASLDMDPHGRIFVSEANRFWLKQCACFLDNRQR